MREEVNLRPIISLLTDFGDFDPYVGIMKGVMAGIAPDAQFIDLTHNIALGDTRAGGYALLKSAPFFPAGTVHLAVVDPGVGSVRRPIAVASEVGYFVGPDNGLFTYLYQSYEHRVVALKNERYRLSPISNTFHGRDIFAPAAAHLAMGVPLEALGPPVPDSVRFELPRLAERSPSEIAGEFMNHDRFGNLGTSIARLSWDDNDTLSLRPWLKLPVAPRRFKAWQASVEIANGSLTLKGIKHTFSDVAEGDLAAIIGSEGHLAIVVNRGSAREKLGPKATGEVILRLPEETHTLNG